MRFASAMAVAALALAAAGCERKPAAPGPSPARAPTPSATAEAAGDSILIGHVASLTGDQATYGVSSDNGIKLAIAELNAKGGVKGRRLALRTYDDEGIPEKAAAAATRLAVHDKVAVLLGEVASSRSLAMAPIADGTGIPMISTASTHPRVTRDSGRTRPYVFRVCFVDPFQGAVMAKFAREHLRLAKVAVLRDVGNDYSVGLADFFVARFEELGGTIVSDQGFKAGDRDFQAQLTAIASTRPQMIYVPAYYADVALIGRQARELGIGVPLAGGDGWDSDRLFEIAGGALDGSYFTDHYTHENPAPLVQRFVQRYREAYGAVPDAAAALGYDAARVAADAMSRAPDLSGQALREAIGKTKDFPGVTGRISLDAGHDAVKPAVVIGIRGNVGRYLTTVEP
jgi:branched-chain amino acid transport system substrate-binding protein